MFRNTPIDIKLRNEEEMYVAGDDGGLGLTGFGEGCELLLGPMLMVGCDDGPSDGGKLVVGCTLGANL